VVIVVTRVLRVEPADQPDVDVGVAIQLSEVALLRVVADEVVPERTLVPQASRELGHVRALEVLPRRESFLEPRADVGHPKRRVGLSRQSATATACPKRRTSRKVGRGSTIGASIP